LLELIADATSPTPDKLTLPSALIKPVATILPTALPLILKAHLIL